MCRRLLGLARDGAPRIAVFELADGTVTVIGGGWPGISREPVVLGH